MVELTDISSDGVKIEETRKLLMTVIYHIEHVKSNMIQD